MHVGSLVNQKKQTNDNNNKKLAANLAIGAKQCTKKRNLKNINFRGKKKKTLRILIFEVNRRKVGRRDSLLSDK